MENYLVKNKRNAYLTLIIFSILTILTWQMELYFFGYEAPFYYNWLGKNIHYTIPIALFYFIIWVNAFFNLEKIKSQISLNLYLLFWLSLGGFISIVLLRATYLQGEGLINLSIEPLSSIEFFAVTIFLGFILFFPLIVFYSLKFFKIKIPIRYRLLSFVLFLTSIPILVQFIALLNFLKNNNYNSYYITNIVYAITSGALFGFLFFIFGFPLIYSQKIEPSLIKEEYIDILDDFI